MLGLYFVFYGGDFGLRLLMLNFLGNAKFLTLKSNKEITRRHFGLKGSQILILVYRMLQADFRVGWNVMYGGFVGVWRYINVTDFEYSYKIYTPINNYTENGIVAKLIFKEGLDSELSAKFGLYKVRMRIIKHQSLICYAI